MARDKPQGASHISKRGRNQMFSHSSVRERNGHYEMWVGGEWVRLKESSPLAAGIRCGKYKLKGAET